MVQLMSVMVTKIQSFSDKMTHVQLKRSLGQYLVTNGSHISNRLDNLFIQLYPAVQGDTSGRIKPPVDIKAKDVFQYKLFILKRNFCFDVNGRFGPT